MIAELIVSAVASVSLSTPKVVYNVASDEKKVTNIEAYSVSEGKYLTYIIHSGFISGYQNRYGDNLKPPTNVYHRMTA